MRAAVAACLAAGLLAGCSIATSSDTPSTSPTTTTRRDTGRATRQVDPAQAERLKRALIPLVRAMNNPRPLDKVKVGILDDSQINAANAGNGEFYVTRGLLEQANDDQLLGVLAHEVAHEDLGHVARTQALGTGLSLGVIILDALVPGSGAITPIAGQLILRGYSRNEEYAADRHGTVLLERVGRNREVMIQTLAWLLRTSGGSKGGFFSTHPATDDRIEALRRER
jgi:Zn-dependent protease with chaperone function